MPQKKPRAARQDLFSHLQRQAAKFKSNDAYDAIHREWAQARERIDAFYRTAERLDRKILTENGGAIQIFVRPQLGHAPSRLELLVSIPEGITRKQLNGAVSEILLWRNRLTAFQGPQWSIGLANFVKRNDGQFEFEHATPLMTSNQLNRWFGEILRDAIAHEDDSPPCDPPWNTTWCLNEALSLLKKFGKSSPDLEISKVLARLRDGEEPFEVEQLRNGYEVVKGPFTSKLIGNAIKSWKRKNKKKL